MSAIQTAPDTAVVPDLCRRVEACPGAVGSICEQMRIGTPRGRTVLALTVNKFDADTLMAVVQDITRATELEARVHDEQRRLRAIIENVRDRAIYTVGPDGRVDAWNRSLGRLGHGDRPMWSARRSACSFPPAQRDDAMALLDRGSRFGTADFEGWRVRNDGTRFCGSAIAAALPDQDGRASGYVLVTRDLTIRKRDMVNFTS